MAVLDRFLRLHGARGRCRRWIVVGRGKGADDHTSSQCQVRRNRRPPRLPAGRQYKSRLPGRQTHQMEAAQHQRGTPVLPILK